METPLRFLLIFQRQMGLYLLEKSIEWKRLELGAGTGGHVLSLLVRETN